MALVAYLFVSNSPLLETRNTSVSTVYYLSSLISYLSIDGEVFMRHFTHIETLYSSDLAILQ